MKVSLLILCLILVYGTYRISAKANVSLIEDIHDDGNYKPDNPSVFFETSPSIHKNSLHYIYLFNKLGLHLVGFISNNILQIMCPKKMSFDKMIKLYSVESTDRFTFCYILNLGVQSIAAVFNLIELFLQYIIITKMILQFLNKTIMPLLKQ